METGADYKMLHQSGLILKPQKSEFNKLSIGFFCHICKDGIAPAHIKVQAPQEAVKLRNQSELRLIF